MVILLLFAIHWYASLFFQSFFNHRYAAHQMFKMSPFWEKVCFIGNWLANGSSYLSPDAYGIMHRMHHAFADTENDPHSPKYDGNLFKMMWRTRREYLDILRRRRPIEDRFLKNLPTWPAFDHFADSIVTRTVFAVAYVGLYAWLATAWWQWLFLPITIVMGPVHGVIINWFAHKFGYTNFEVNDTSKNLLPLDFLMWGESYHNNHHKNGSSPNFGYKWWEIDPMWPIIKVLNWVGVISLRIKAAPKNLRIRFSPTENARIKAALARLPHLRDVPQVMPERKLAQLVSAWKQFVEQDWKGNVAEYYNNISVREELQVILENVNGSIRKKITGMVEPFDKAFQSKMKPLEVSKIKERWGQRAKNFWQTHTIFQGELA